MSAAKAKFQKTALKWGIADAGTEICVPLEEKAKTTFFVRMAPPPVTVSADGKTKTSTAPSKIKKVNVGGVKKIKKGLSLREKPLKSKGYYINGKFFAKGTLIQPTDIAGAGQPGQSAPIYLAGTGKKPPSMVGTITIA